MDGRFNRLAVQVVHEVFALFGRASPNKATTRLALKLAHSPFFTSGASVNFPLHWLKVHIIHNVFAFLTTAKPEWNLAYGCISA